MLSKSSQTQEDILCDSIYRNSRKGKTNLRWKKHTGTVVVSGDGEECLGGDMEALSGDMGVF